MTGLLVYKQTLNGGWMELKSDSIEANASTPSLSLSAFRQQLSPSLSLPHCSRSRRNGKAGVFLPTAASAICPDLPERRCSTVLRL